MKKFVFVLVFVLAIVPVFAHEVRMNVGAEFCNKAGVSVEVNTLADVYESEKFSIQALVGLSAAAVPGGDPLLADVNFGIVCTFKTDTPFSVVTGFYLGVGREFENLFVMVPDPTLIASVEYKLKDCLAVSLDAAIHHNMALGLGGRVSAGVVVLF